MSASRRPAITVTSATDVGGGATYTVVAASHARGVATYRLLRPGTKRVALELLVADTSGMSYGDVIASGDGRLAIARDGIVLRTAGPAGDLEERAFLRALHSPAPTRPLRRTVRFTSALLDARYAGDASGGRTSRLYKLFGMFPNDDDVELLLAVALDERSVTFLEKDETYRPLLTRFLSR